MPFPTQMRLLGVILVSACTVSLTQVLRSLPEIQPSEPTTPEDSLTAITLQLAIGARLIRGPWVVLVDSERPPSAGSLPHTDSIKFVFMPGARVQEIADEYGDFTYVRLGPAFVVGNDGRVSFEVRPAVSRQRGPVILGGLLACQWRFTRPDEQWVAARRPICLVT